MSKVDIRERIHEGIENLDDYDTLVIIDDLLSRSYHAPKRVSLSPEQTASLALSENDVTAGRTIGRETARDQVTEWLNRNP